MFKVIEEGITFSEELIGIDANILYRHLLHDGKAFREIRGYVFVVVQKIVKIGFQLTRKAPHLKNEILTLIFDEVINDLRKIIQKHHRNLEGADILQIWAEIEFFGKFMEKDGDDVKGCFHNLKKIWSKKKGMNKLASENEIFSQDLKIAKEDLVCSELNKVKLIQSVLSG
jgi:hypothetical protein